MLPFYQETLSQESMGNVLWRGLSVSPLPGTDLYMVDSLAAVVCAFGDIREECDPASGSMLCDCC